MGPMIGNGEQAVDSRDSEINGQVPVSFDRMFEASARLSVG